MILSIFTRMWSQLGSAQDQFVSCANPEEHEESDDTVIFSLERLLRGGTKLTRDYANKLGKPFLHIYHTRHERILAPDFLRHEVQTLTDFLGSNKIEILNVAGPRESKEPGVYDWTLAILRLSLNRAAYGCHWRSENPVNSGSLKTGY